MESIELMSKEIESAAPVEERIPAEISGLLDAVQMLTDKVNDLVASYAVKVQDESISDDLEVVEDTVDDQEVES